MVLLGLSGLVCLVILTRTWWWPDLKLKPYFVSLELDDSDVLLEIEPLLDQFRFKLKDKLLIRDEGLRLEIRYVSHPIAHHLFLKRVYAMDTIGKIVVI